MSPLSLTPRQRVETALRGGCADRVPFTIYESKLPPGTAAPLMRNRGLCIVNRSYPVYRTHRPNVTHRSESCTRDGVPMTRDIYETPVGVLTTLSEPAGFTSWAHEKMYKTPEDFKTIRFLIEDERYEPTYDAFAQAQDAMGQDIIFRANLSLEPLQMLISGPFFRMEQFAIEWMDHRDEMLGLYEAIAAKHRELYPIVARSPALFANYGGNVVPSLIGRDVFERYYVPHYNAAAAVFHEQGKLLGCHFDDDCGLLRDLIAATDLDYIEAFTPAPDTDMSLADARAAWPDKVLWINFPSSQHLKSDQQIEAITLELLNDAGRMDGLLFAVTEDVPEHRWRHSCQAIMNGLDRHAEEQPHKYR